MGRRDAVLRLRRPATLFFSVGFVFFAACANASIGAGPLPLLSSALLGQDQIPTADLTIEDRIGDRDGQGLVPLMDWMPLFNLQLTWSSEDEPAPRFLSTLLFQLIGDPVDARPWDRLAFLNITDYMEFGIFEEFDSLGGKNPDEIDGQLNEDDVLLYTFTNTGQNSVPGFDVFVNNTTAPIDYFLSWNHNTVPPGFLLETSSPEAPNSYIIAIRTSATWRNALTLSYRVTFGQMLLINFNNTTSFPVDDMGMPLDSYSPDFFADGGPEFLEPEVGYSSSFAAWDVTGGPVETESIGDGANQFFGNWNHRVVRQTSTTEFRRPRFDSLGTPFNFVFNEFMQLRELVPLDDWIPLIGINIHSAAPPVREHSFWLIGDPGEPQADLQEVNVVFTDVGADPLGPPGNGGFNPITGFERLTFSATVSGEDDFTTAINDDFTFNGAWVFHDTNGNGIFDPPTPMADGQGVSLTDLPMFPTFNFASLPEWEYVPSPPGGGDPWWKLKIPMTLGARRFDTATDTTGMIEGVPDGDNMPGFPEFSTSGNPEDYFVVMRSDSGFIDVSTIFGDGTGIQPGADFKAFIEPRRINAVTGNFDGGIYVDSMIPGNSLTNPGAIIIGKDGGPKVGGSALKGNVVWQNDPRWGFEEPWWPQRTNNSFTTKTTRVGFEVHDLVMTYEGAGRGAFVTDVPFYGPPFLDALLGLGGSQSQIGRWLDPFSLLADDFFNFHSPGVVEWSTQGVFFNVFYFPYEQAPFRNPTDLPPNGPRSFVFPNPPVQPSIIDFSTWPALLNPGEYPRWSDWQRSDRAARLFRQRIDPGSEPTAMLGINVVGSNDVRTNTISSLRVSQITVAFWGPNFTPSDLLPLDPEGIDDDSGVALWVDCCGDGIVPVTPFGGLVPAVISLNDLEWSNAPEPVDLSGDGVPDDLNGDDIVDNADHAWVLRLNPQQAIVAPPTDFRTADDPNANIGHPFPLDSFAGDDLFVMVRTSNTLSQFEQFRAVVPATLPNRAGAERSAGIRFLPSEFGTPSAFTKSNPEEPIEQDFIGLDTLAANVPVKLVNLAPANSRIPPTGAPIAVLGVDMSTNMPENTLATGSGGIGGTNTFTVQDANFTPGAFIGRWLVDDRNETFEIVNNSDNQLTLLSGTPQDGGFKILKDPSFLEQMIVEFYNEVDPADPNDVDLGTEFNILIDLLPLDMDQTISGVALYRDNDAHPGNTNGVFDPDIDIPLTLDDRPALVGEVGEPDTQVRFVFSTPGTDDVPMPIEDQERNRQWVPDTFGIGEGDPNTGPEIFVVVRASDRIDEGDDFSVGLVGFGPNTPTEPDPDTFSFPLPPELITGEVNKFRAFAFMQRALGFVSFFEEPPVLHYLEGHDARSEPDASGFNWIRTHTNKFVKSNRMIGDRRRANPAAVLIESTSVSVIPTVIQPGDTFTFVISGINFGSSPVVTLSSYDVTILESADDEISVRLRNRDGVTPTEPLVLSVRNTQNGTQDTRTDLLRLSSSDQPQPNITSISPDSGGQDAFPVTIRGSNFNMLPRVQVLFDGVRMPIRSVSVAGDQIVVNFPLGGFPNTGALNVTVRNLTALGELEGEDTLIDAFVFVNRPATTPCFVATAAYGTPLARELDAFRAFRDDALLKNAAGAAFTDAYYRMSPAAADVIARTPVLASAARWVLTTAAAALGHPYLFASIVASLLTARRLRRRTARKGTIRG